MKLIYKTVNLSSYKFSNQVSKYFDDLPEGGRFYCNLARMLSPEAYIARYGDWSDPFDYKILEGYEIPDNTNMFKKDFEEVTDSRAHDIKRLIEKTDKRCIIFYSGGIDSTVTVSSLIKNLEKKHLEKITIAMSADSIVENPHFFLNHICNKFQLIDSAQNMYSDCLSDQRNICVSSDLGDFIYGTEFGVKLYPQILSLVETMPVKTNKNYFDLSNKVHDPETHYSQYRDLLIHYFNTSLSKGCKKLNSISYIPQNISNYSSTDENFGELFYEKIRKNINNSDIDILSLHDFFWWTMFNMRFIWGALRPLSTYATLPNLKSAIDEGLFNWYCSKDYQRWSMNNNNNGEKMNGITQSTYKWASRKYIFNFDKNEYYFHNKIKMPSMPILVARKYKSNLDDLDAKWGVDDNFNTVKITEPGSSAYVHTRLFDFKIDWIN